MSPCRVLEFALNDDGYDDDDVLSGSLLAGKTARRNILGITPPFEVFDSHQVAF